MAHAKLPDNQLRELHRLMEEMRQHTHALSLHSIQMPRLCDEVVSKLEEALNQLRWNRWASDDD